MKYILGLMIVAVMAGLVWRKPPWALCFYLLIMSTTGIRGYVCSITFSKLPILLQVMELYVIALAGIKLHNDYCTGHHPYRVYLLAWLTAILAGVLFVARYVFGSGLGDSLATLGDFPLLLFIPVMAYWRDGKARAAFMAVLIIHLALAIAIVVFPGDLLDRFSGLQYMYAEAVERGLSESFAWQVARLGDAAPVMAHFGNQNSYVQASAIGILIGIWLFIKRTSPLRKVAGLLLAVLATLGVMASFGRAAGLGLVLGLAVFAVMRSRTKSVGIPLVALSMIAAAYIIAGSSLASRFEELYLGGYGLEYRLSALYAMKHYVAEYGLFGVPTALHYSGDLSYSPHETICFATYRYGVAAGLLVAFFEVVSLLGGGSVYKRIARSIDRNTSFFKPLINLDDLAVFRASAVCMIVAGLGNGFAGGSSYWMWFFACCIPWLYSRWEWERYSRAVSLAGRV